MKIGEYELDNIYNEDCYEAIKNIPDKSIDLIIIDPPYKYKTGGVGKNQDGEYKKLYDRKNNNRNDLGDLSIYTDNDRQKLIKKYIDNGKSYEQARIWADKVINRKNISHISSGFDLSILDQLDKKLKKINIYIWCSKHQISKILQHYEKKGCNIEIITWHKTNPLPTCNNTYANDTEYCVFAREGGVLLKGTLETKRKYYVSGLNQKDKKYYYHPTIKPLTIIKNFIINSSDENDIVLDCFLGSGTTAVASKELNRHYIGFEIDKNYFKIAQDRLNGITQQDIIKEEQGYMTLF